MPITLPIDMKDRRFVLSDHSGDTFTENDDYDGLALTLEANSPEEAKAILEALLSDQSS